MTGGRSPLPPLLLTGAIAITAAWSPPPVQLGFAAVAVGVVGMAHGAGDLAVVPPDRRPLFLLLYAVIAATCLFWWIADPAVALPFFLLASVAHFAAEDAPDSPWWRRGALGVLLVAGPAVLHPDAYRAILRAGGAADGLAAAATLPLAALGALSAALLVPSAGRRLLAGGAALLFGPPLVGFSVGFLVLHALPQTAARRRRLGYPTDLAYLRAVWPVLAAALLLAATIGWALWPHDPTGIRALLAAVAALAMPHLLVTPWFERVSPRTTKPAFPATS